MNMPTSPKSVTDRLLKGYEFDVRMPTFSTYGRSVTTSLHQDLVKCLVYWAHYLLLWYICTIVKGSVWGK